MLEQHLLEFDGRAVTLLSEARAACRDDPDYWPRLIALCLDPREHVADGATWILKAELEEGAHLSPELTATLVAGLYGLSSWQAPLHVCQFVDRLELTPEQAGRVIDWAKSYANHARPFLRAWSLHARVVLATRFPDHWPDAERALVGAENDPAGSVKARARKLRKVIHGLTR